MNQGHLRQPVHAASWWSRHIIEIVVAVGGLLAMNAIFLAQAFREGDSVSPAGASQLGDFVGGYVGTGFVLVSVLLLYSTLKNQRYAYQLQSFESRLFELIKMHRDNVAEMQLQTTEGRRVFIKLFHELWAISEIVKRLIAAQEAQLTERQVLCIAYYCLFYGVGEGSSRMLKHSLKDFDESLIATIDQELQKPEVRKQAQDKFALGYEPFEGHQSRLGHYYRHLYQTIRYVDQQRIGIDKYEYGKTLRAQLTTHEQALLLINSLAPIGQNWWIHGLVLKYRMVQNLPRYFLDPIFDIENAPLFPKDYFEWEEIKSST